MDPINQAFLEELKASRVSNQEHRAEQLQSSRNIEKLLDKILYRSIAIFEKYLVNGYTIENGDNYEVPPVSSPDFEKARVFCSVGFNENTTAGITIDLYYAGHYICEILNVKPTTAGMSAGSEAFDINKLSGFNLVIRNRDVSQDVKINTLKIIMYNE